MKKLKELMNKLVGTIEKLLDARDLVVEQKSHQWLLNHGKAASGLQKALWFLKG